MGNTEAICQCLEKHGPLYVRAVVPSLGKDDPDYTPWFLAHVDSDQLSDDAVQSHLREFEKLFDGDDPYADGLGDFFEYLAGKGYVTLHSANHHGIIRLANSR